MLVFRGHGAQQVLREEQHGAVFHSTDGHAPARLHRLGGSRQEGAGLEVEAPPRLSPSRRELRPGRLRTTQAQEPSRRSLSSSRRVGGRCRRLGRPGVPRLRLPCTGWRGVQANPPQAAPRQRAGAQAGPRQPRGEGRCG
eukprot:7602163-Alexandrium_andersonii.AAC.1